jgi:hypothetical protein
MDFSLPAAVDWGWGTGIPAGGHLSQRFTMDVADHLQEDGAWRVFSGSVGGDLAKVMATLSNGKRLSIKPRSVQASLRRKVVWLRNVRYFVQYYPADRLRDLRFPVQRIGSAPLQGLRGRTF